MTHLPQLKAVIAAREKASARLSIVLQTRGYTIIDTDYKPDDVKFYNIASAFFLTDAPKLVAEIERYRAALQKCSAHTSRTEKTLKAECIAALTGKGETGC
ncbi:hypothetical protein [Rhodopila sp.]|uniref:hypothetical protein n=1 Tax=Rhodopila sp. TaxID=2480087 RepID=UPI003D118AEB